MYVQNARGKKEKVFILSEPKETTDIRQSDEKESKKLHKRHVGFAKLENSTVIAYLRRTDGMLDELHSGHAPRIFKKVDITEAIENDNLRPDLGTPYFPTAVFNMRKQEHEKFRLLEAAAKKWWEEKQESGDISFYYNYESFRDVHLNSRRVWNDFRLDNEEVLRNIHIGDAAQQQQEQQKVRNFWEVEEFDSRRLDPKYFQRFSQVIARLEQQKGKIPEPKKLTKRGIKKERKRKLAAEKKEEEERKKQERATKRRRIDHDGEDEKEKDEAEEEEEAKQETSGKKEEGTKDKKQKEKKEAEEEEQEEEEEEQTESKKQEKVAEKEQNNGEKQPEKKKRRRKKKNRAQNNQDAATAESAQQQQQQPAQQPLQKQSSPKEAEPVKAKDEPQQQQGGEGTKTRKRKRKSGK